SSSPARGSPAGTWSGLRTASPPTPPATRSRPRIWPRRSTTCSGSTPRPRSARPTAGRSPSARGAPSPRCSDGSTRGVDPILPDPRRVKLDPEPRPFGDGHPPVADLQGAGQDVLDEAVVGAVVGEREVGAAGGEVVHRSGLRAEVAGAVDHVRDARRRRDLRQ